MMHTDTWTFILLFLLSILFVEVSGSALVPVRTKVEYIDQPIGLDVENPRFSWVLEAKRESVFGQKQTAYRIIVASTVEKIRNGEGEVWDSKWVEDSGVMNIDYEGIPLLSDRKCLW